MTIESTPLRFGKAFTSQEDGLLFYWYLVKLLAQLKSKLLCVFLAGHPLLLPRQGGHHSGQVVYFSFLTEVMS